MRISLKPFKNYSKEFTESYEDSFKEIDRIQEDEAINDLVKSLAAASRINYQVCLLDLKSYLLNSQMHFPEHLEVKLKNTLLLPRFLLLNFFRCLKHKKAKHAEVIIDRWSEGVMSHFYGEELVEQIEKSCKCNVISMKSAKMVQLSEFLKILFPFVEGMLLANRIIKQRKIDLREYIYVFYFNLLCGRSIQKFYRPKLIVSGDHNGFPIIKAKAAGAEIILIPNGRFDCSGDTAFKYADYFMSFGGKYIIESTMKNGCHFKNIYPFGSLRVYNFIQGTKDRKFDVIYDLLWGSYGCNLFEDLRHGYYSKENEYEAIKLINKYASKKGVKVAYHCRFDDEVDNLKKLGLFSENIDYLPSSFSLKPKSIYAAIKESKIVLSSFSSICHEAIALGVKSGYVNLSGNQILNAPYRNAGIEYNLSLSGKMSFDEFIEEIKNKKINKDEYIVQNPNYVKDLLKIINGVVKNKR